MTKGERDFEKMERADNRESAFMDWEIKESAEMGGVDAINGVLPVDYWDEDKEERARDALFESLRRKHEEEVAEQRGVQQQRLIERHCLALVKWGKMCRGRRREERRTIKKRERATFERAARRAARSGHHLQAPARPPTIPTSERLERELRLRKPIYRQAVDTRGVVGTAFALAQHEYSKIV